MRTDLKIEVTVNDNGFDKPTDVDMSIESELPTCDLMFPSGSSNLKISKKDVVKIYIGYGGLPTLPRFTGFLDEEYGLRDSQLSLVGGLYPATRKNVLINDSFNFDGREVSNALYELIGLVPEFSGWGRSLEATTPITRVPDNTRIKTGISIYDLMKQFRNLAIDPVNPLDIKQYSLFENSKNIFFRKMPIPSEVNPWATLRWTQDLVSADPLSSTRNTLNAQRAIGKDDVSAIYENAHRIAVDGYREGEIISDQGMITEAECFETSRATTLANLFKMKGLVVNSPMLLNCIPGMSVIEIANAPFGLSDKYLLRTLSIKISENDFNVTGNISVPSDIVSEGLSQLLGLNRMALLA